LPIVTETGFTADGRVCAIANSNRSEPDQAEKATVANVATTATANPLLNYDSFALNSCVPMSVALTLGKPHDQPKSQQMIS
jgi:hypothetical protein